MTRESIPGFDLYAELEVARVASAEVIDAAYRTLAKRHHPDVSRAIDAERIKRLNLAHDWLIDPVRRRRYDNATQATARPAGMAPAVSAADDDPFGPTRASSTRAFGLNTAEVRQFLAELRTIDEARAAEIHAAKVASDPMAHAAAQHEAFTAAQAQRESQWLLAREAASVIVRGKLHGSPREVEVAGLMSDVAGAIAIRDLIPRSDFDVLLQPWSWRGDRRAAAAPPTVATATPAAASAPVVPVVPVELGVGAARGTGSRVAAARQVRLGRTGRPILTAPPALVAVLALVLLVGAGLALGGPRRETAVAGVTDAPSSTAPPLAGEASALPSDGATVSGPSDSPLPSEPGASTAPTGTAAPGRTPVPTRAFVATPRPTLTPTAVPTAVPTPVPTAAATAVPTAVPTMIPSPSPPVFCTVPPFVGQSTGAAPGLWSTAFFTGTITYSPVVPPQYKVGWQSLTAGTSVLCTSNVTLQQVAPTPAP